jgi:acetyltransferase-like isoleucine patch superfamily enzyme
MRLACVVYHNIFVALQVAVLKQRSESRSRAVIDDHDPQPVEILPAFDLSVRHSCAETNIYTVHRLLAALLRKSGKDYRPDRNLPSGLIFNVIRVRFLLLARGMLRFRRAVFVDSQVRVRGKRYIQLGRGATLDRGVALDGYARRGVQIGARTRIGSFTVVSCTSHLSLFGEGFSIGDDSGIGDYGWIGAAGGVTVGSNVIMGQFVSFHSQEHEFDGLTTPIRQQGTTQLGITIGDDCWVGARVTFLDGSSVGEGCVIAAGSVVRGEIPPFSVVAGVPARIVRSRRTEDLGK